MSERKIVEYYSIWSHNFIDDEINDRIKNGWQPFGGFSVFMDGDGDFTYCQAVVKYEENDE